MSSSSDKRCVIVGGSHAGIGCAQKLRRLGWSGSIVVIGDEPHLPYHRPPLSKDYLKGTKDGDSIRLGSIGSYEKADIELRRGVQVISIDRDQRRVLTSDEAELSYNTLVLATGARARELPFAPRTLSGVCYLRDMHDVDRIRKLAAAAKRAVVIGGGYIGLEAAATMRGLGLEVTVVEAMDRVLQRVTSEPVSTFFARVHGEEGVDVREGEQVSGLAGVNRVEAVELGSGIRLDADLVVVGIGVIPNTALAEAAGLPVDNGISVDAFNRTADPDIYAIGDCASFVHGLYQRQMRLESIQNANDHGMTAARSITGAPEPYTALPWFWSDQYDVKLQIAGLSEGHDDMVIRGTADAGRTMSVFYLKDDRLLSVDAMNSPRDFLHGKKLILDNAVIDRQLLVDPDIPLKETVVSS